MRRRQFATMRAHEGGTRLGEDPEELHAGHRKRRVPSRAAFAMGALAERNLQEAAGIRASL